MKLESFEGEYEVIGSVSSNVTKASQKPFCQSYGSVTQEQPLTE